MWACFFKSNLITLIIIKSLRITDCGAEMKLQSRTLRFWSASKRKWIVCKSEETLKVEKIRNLKIVIEKSESFWSNPNSFKNWLFLIFKNYKRQGLFCIVTKPVIGCPDDTATFRKNTKPTISKRYFGRNLWKCFITRDVQNIQSLDFASILIKTISLASLWFSISSKLKTNEKIKFIVRLSK